MSIGALAAFCWLLAVNLASVAMGPYLSRPVFYALVLALPWVVWVVGRDHGVLWQVLFLAVVFWQLRNVVRFVGRALHALATGQPLPDPDKERERHRRDG